MAFAGLWESFHWSDETVTRTFTIMTTTPNAEMSELHDRMPVILDQQDWPTWLGEAEGDCAALLRPAPDGLLREARRAPVTKDRRRAPTSLVEQPANHRRPLPDAVAMIVVMAETSVA